ncbi:MAG: hypothetical protein ACPGNV_14915 [Mangrovicoccus sp.]
MPRQITFDDLVAGAELMGRVYDDPYQEDVIEKIENKGVQAYYLRDGTLVIPGTNESFDWVDFNFEAFNIIGKKPSLVNTVMGDSGEFEWHAGFLEHAHTVFTFANVLKPKLIIGHSLGAASAQIVGASMKIPTLAYASPRPLRGQSQPEGANCVLNILRSDDLVCDVPPKWLGFFHVGQVVRMNPRGIHLGEDHRINHYLDAMADSAVKPKLDEFLPATLIA